MTERLYVMTQNWMLLGVNIFHEKIFEKIYNKHLQVIQIKIILLAYQIIVLNINNIALVVNTFRFFAHS